MNYLTLEHNNFSESYFNVSNYLPKTSWNGSGLAIAHQSGDVSFWDLRNMEKTTKIVNMHHEDCRSVEYNPSCRYLATSSFDCSVKIYDTEEEKYTHFLSIYSF